MELTVEKPCQYVTWKIRDFLQLPSKEGYFLDSPKIRFAGDSYCMRLYTYGKEICRKTPSIEFYLVRLTSTFSKINVSYKVGYRYRNEKGEEFDEYLSLSSLNVYLSIRRSLIEKNKYMFLADGTFTVYCSMRLREQSSSGSPQTIEAETSGAEEQQEGLAGKSVFSSRWNSSKMELSVESPYQYVTWKIPNFLQLSSEIGYFLDSPEFRFGDDSYCLALYPNGDRKEDTRCIGLKVVRLTTTVPEMYASCKVGHAWINKDDYEFYTVYRPDMLTGEYRICLPRSDVEKNTGKYVPEGIFSVICSMRLKESCGSGSPQSEETKTSDAEEEQEVLAAVSKLRSDYRQLLQKGARSDACLVVSGKEFRAHRCVLGARSDVFEAMFSHETAENESGRVVINDLDPESFGEFLEYLYTGSIGAGLSDDNAFGLYAAADKYDVATLKSECVAHMRRNLSVDSFCDVMTLALRHGEENLLQSAIEFFKVNLPRIIVTVKWQRFLADNSTSANELLIKTFVPGEQ